MRVVGIVQARMGSRRLPGKVLMPLAGAPMLQRLLERLQWSRRLDAVVVATSDLEADDPVAALTTGMGLPVSRGSEPDVLARMLDAAAQLQADIVVRLTGDNPLVDGTLVDYLLDGFLPDVPPLVYAQNVDGSGFPPGLSVEAISIEALRAAARSDEPDDREHVTLFVRRRSDIYPSLLVRSPRPAIPTAVTVDTLEDYTRVRALFERIYARNARFGFMEVLNALAKAERSPE